MTILAHQKLIQEFKKITRFAGRNIQVIKNFPARWIDNNYEQ